MAKKFYAVKVGRKQGIFQTWEECKNRLMVLVIQFIKALIN